MRRIKPPMLDRKTPLARGLQDPVPVERERRNAGQAAAAAAAVRPGRPADDANDGGTTRSLLEYGPAGIPGAGAEPVAGALRERIDQPDLQRARLAGRDQAGDADGSAATALAADGDTDAGDGEAAADHDWNLRHAEHRGIFALRRRFELQQRYIGGGAVGEHRLQIEARVNAQVFHVLQLRLPVDAVLDDFVDRPRLHTMRRGQYQFWCNQGARTKVTARADDRSEEHTSELQ